MTCRGWEGEISPQKKQCDHQQGNTSHKLDLNIPWTIPSMSFCSLITTVKAFLNAIELEYQCPHYYYIQFLRIILKKNPNLTATLTSPIENVKIAVNSTSLYMWSLRGEGTFWVNLHKLIDV